MREVKDRLTQISTLVTERQVADIPSPDPPQEGSPTSTDSSTSTLRGDDSLDNSSVVRAMSMPAPAVAMAAPSQPKDSPEGTDSSSELLRRGRSIELLKEGMKETPSGEKEVRVPGTCVREGLHSRHSRTEERKASGERARDIYATLERRPRARRQTSSQSFDGTMDHYGLERSAAGGGERRRRDGSLERKIDRILGRRTASGNGREGGFEKNGATDGGQREGARAVSLEGKEKNRGNRGGLSRPNSREDRSRSSSRADHSSPTDLTSLNPKTLESLQRYQRIKHRPLTPEPTGPPVSETKLQVSPERKLRRKSEGMKPIEKKVDMQSLVHPPRVAEEEEKVEEAAERGRETEKERTVGREATSLEQTKEACPRVVDLLGPQSTQLSSGKAVELPSVALHTPSPETEMSPPTLESNLAPPTSSSPTAGARWGDTPESTRRDAVASKGEASSHMQASTNGEVQLRQRSPVSEHLKQVRADWRKTPIISTDAVDAILRGEISDEEEDAVEAKVGKRRRSREMSPLVTAHHTLETCMEEDEGLPGHTQKTTLSQAPDKASSTFPLAPALRGGRQPSSPERRDRRVKLSVETRTKSTSDYSPEPLELDDQDTLSSSYERHPTGQVSRLRASTMVLSRSTPDLTQILNGSSAKPSGRRVERSQSRRLLGRTRLDSYVTMSTTSPTHSSSRTRGYATLPNRIFGTSFGLTSTKSHDRDRRKGRRS